MLAAVLLCSEGAAQEPLYIGVSGGYEFGLPLSFNRQPGVINRYGFDGAGISEDRGGRIGAYLGLPSLISENLGLVFQANYLFATGSYLSDPFNIDPVFDPFSNRIIDPSYRLALESTTGMLELSAATSHTFAGNWTVGGGLWGSYRVRGAFTKVLRRQLGGSDELEVEREEGERLGTGKFRLGLGATMGTRISLFSGVMLQPELFTRFDPMALGDVGVLQTFSLGGGVSLLFDAGSPAPADTAAPPPLADNARTDSVPPRPPRLEATIDLFSIDAGGERSQASAVRPVSLLRRQQMPFPATVFFDPGSAAIPSRYVRLTPAEAATFSVSDLVRLEPAALYGQALNLLGLRLLGNPGARVRLVGTYGSGEPGTLGRLRAESVRAYLRDVWGVAESRIAVREASSGDRAPAPGTVRLEGPDEILAPVVTEWRRRTYVPLDIDLEPAIEAEAGVRFWSVTVRQGDRVLSSYSSRPEDSLSGAELALHIPEENNEDALPPLVAELLVEDSTGGRRMATDTLSLVRRVPVGTGGSPEGGDGELRSELVYLVSWNDGDSWGKNKSRGGWIAELAEAMRPGARATVSPAAPAPSRNGEACGPCADIAARLKARTGSAVTVEIPRNTPSADPGSPEARMIGSLVRVEIQQSGESGSAGRP